LLITEAKQIKNKLELVQHQTHILHSRKHNLKHPNPRKHIKQARSTFKPKKENKTSMVRSQTEKQKS